MASRKQLEAGDRAPDFELDDQAGSTWRLAAALEKSPVVLFFYPKDDTPICIAEACSFRDRHEDFVGRGAVVVGVSSDSVASHRSFADRHDLPFTLLSDRDRRVRGLYGVKKTLGFIDGRVTFVIDRDGTIRHAYSSQFSAKNHSQEALDVLERIAGTE